MILARAAGTTKPDGLSHDATEVAVWMAVFLFVDTVVVGLRLWVTRMRKRSLMIPDYMVFAALVRINEALFDEVTKVWFGEWTGLLLLLWGGYISTYVMFSLSKGGR